MPKVVAGCAYWSTSEPSKLRGMQDKQDTLLRYKIDSSRHAESPCESCTATLQKAEHRGKTILFVTALARRVYCIMQTAKTKSMEMKPTFEKRLDRRRK
jgi:hypothetical protein